MPARYPVTLDVEGRPCVVLGGDETALRKVGELLDAGATVTVVAAGLCAGLATLADAGTVAWRAHAPSAADLEGAWLAVDASGDEALNAPVFEAAERTGVLLNVIDRPARCHFTTPAVVRRGPLQVAIATGGESPFLAGALRARLERDLGEEWGGFVSLVGRVRRRLRRDGVSFEQQRSVYRRLLRSDIRRLLRSGRADAAEYAAAAITDSPAPVCGRVTLVGAGPGDPGLLTLRGRELLGDADIVFHDALVSPEVLALCAPEAELVDVGKRGGRPNPEQEDITAMMIAAARRGLDVVRLKGGDPFIFGRGGEEVAGLVEAGIDVAVVPGVSSAAAAPALAGIPLTLRGVASSVAIVTGRGGEGAGRPDRLEELAAAVDTLVVLMPLGGLEELASRLASVLGAARPAALVCRAGTEQQLTIGGTLGSIASRARREDAPAPATLVVGEVVAAMRGLEQADAGLLTG